MVELARRLRMIGLGCAIVAARGTAQQPAAQTPPGSVTPTPRTQSPRDTAAASAAAVTSISGGTIYVNAGRADGMVEGMELSVVRQDTVQATLRVLFLASHQSACEVVKGAVDIVIGDVVRFYPQINASTSPQPAYTALRRPHRLSGPGLHGRVGARYLRADEQPSSSGFSQPSGDLRLDGLALGGTPIGLAVDLRTRHTTTSAADGSSQVDGHTRVYQATLLWRNPGAGFRMAVGRQYLTAVTSVSLFDGGLIELNSSHFTFGGFGGLEPEPVDLGFSSETQDFGGYVQAHNRPGKPTIWSFTLGAVGSYRANVANREFAFAQASISSRYLSLYAQQEVDYYRKWKVLLGEQQVTPTSTYVSGSIRPNRWLAFNGSYDDRRNVRLYRDAVDPATSFDDSFREGYGGGLALFGHRLRASGDVRRTRGGSSGAGMDYTGTFGIDRLTPLRLSLTGRGTWYHYASSPTAASSNGQLYTGRLGVDPLSLLHLDFNGGWRRETFGAINASTAGERQYTWYGIDLDLSLARAWFISASAQREAGPSTTTTQLYSSITWRF